MALASFVEARVGRARIGREGKEGRTKNEERRGKKEEGGMG
jgi:hypothetical protein